MEFTVFSDSGENITDIPKGQKEEKKTTYSGFSKSENNLRNQDIHVDWRTKGMVQPVIHQGSCGSCWAIAATDVYNSFRAITKKDKTRYSHQQVVDCGSPEYNCQRGGSQFIGLNYIKENKMCTDEEYEYVGSKNQCREYMCNNESGIKDVLTLSSQTALDHLKDKGPFAAIIGSNRNFLLYSDGIYNGSCEAKEKHSVVVVGHGYDREKKVNYWIVKNSWGEEWGEEGYFRILDDPSLSTDPSKGFCNFLEHSHGIV